MGIEDVGFNFDETASGDGGILDLRIKGYSDVMLVTIPIRIDNPRDEDVYLEKVGFKISMVGSTIEERVMEDVEIPAKDSEILTLEDVKITAEELDEILPRVKMDVDHPEEATLRLAVDVYIFYPVELGPLRTIRPKIRHTRFEGYMYLRSILGGRTKEEAVAELF